MASGILIEVLRIPIVKGKEFQERNSRRLLLVFLKMLKKFGQPAKVGKFNMREQRFQQE